MNGQQRACQQFLRHDEVADVGARESLAGVAVAGLINGTRVAGEGRVHQVEASLGREC